MDNLNNLWQFYFNKELLSHFSDTNKETLEKSYIWISDNMFFKINDGKLNLYGLGLSGCVEGIIEEKNIIDALKEYLILIQEGHYNFFYKNCIKGDNNED